MVAIQSSILSASSLSSLLLPPSSLSVLLVKSTRCPWGVYTSTTPLEQKNVPKGQRMAYICQDCGYIYDLDTPFEEQDDATYACPVCTAPKDSFVPANATVDYEPYDVTKGVPANSGPGSKKSQNMN